MAESVPVHVRKYRLCRWTWQHLAISVFGANEWRGHFPHSVLYLALYHWLPDFGAGTVARSAIEMWSKWGVYEISSGISRSWTGYGGGFGVRRAVL